MSPAVPPDGPQSATARVCLAAANTHPPYWYTLAWVLVLPVVGLYLLWRSLRQREYRQHWGERFLGRGAQVPGAAANAGPLVWVHAVSVGETRAAQPLIEQLARAHPAARFVLTHMTPTGRAAGQSLVSASAGCIVQRYLPYDLPFAVDRFLRETRPDVGVLMETEIWPNLLHAAHARHIPVVLANARLSRRSLAKALRQRALMRGAAAAITVVGAQSEADRGRIAQLYDGPVNITGNAKFDIEPDAVQMARGRELRAHLSAALGGRPLWLFASTREGEEKLILDALRLRPVADPSQPRPLLLFVPRHPQRFAAVAALLREQGATVLRRADWDGLGEGASAPSPRPSPGGAKAGFREACLAPPQRPRPTRRGLSGGTASGLGEGASAAATMLLGDSMGEMALYYALADVALIGGSLLPLGGQNLIEACACGCPVVLGPHMFNFAAAADDAIAAGAACRVQDANDALRRMDQITGDPVQRGGMVTAALAFAGAHRGATARTVALIEQALSSSPPASALSAAASRSPSRYPGRPANRPPP